MTDEIHLKYSKRSDELDEVGQLYGKSNPAFHTDVDTTLDGKHGFDLNVTLNEEESLPRKVTQTANEWGQHEVNSDDEEDEEDGEYSRYARFVNNIQTSVGSAYKQHKSAIWTLVGILIAGLYTAYFLYAMIKFFDPNDEGMVRLLWFSVLVGVLVIYMVFWTRLSKACFGEVSCMAHCSPTVIRRLNNVIYWFLVIGTTVFVLVYLVIEVALKRPDNLRSAAGIARLRPCLLRLLLQARKSNACNSIIT
ncbi:uncharacterized protein LOC127856090 [Dreissena polymorpha]|uniref:Uncharacterized protein n=1 Tax=Dreissena polymorpha TaxID=45954 RepID=A0A9D4CD57_DREPO|nr:uncharacterized protein LOC127856090 [Dreissena polymorpha]KAH3721350.1 hypothetical protein DPMN_064273 [Dreissena polymorpha]